MKEIWDAYYSDGTKANIDLVRGEPIPDGLYHMVCDISVQHVDGDFLIMRRSLTKNINPGCLELTAGGSSIKGEDALECIKRELREETGITECQITFLNTCINEQKKSIYYNFYGKVNIDKNSIILQPGETCEYMWKPLNEVLQMYYENKILKTSIERRKELFFKK